MIAIEMINDRWIHRYTDDGQMGREIHRWMDK